MICNVLELEKIYENKMLPTICEKFDFTPMWKDFLVDADNLLRMHHGKRELLEYYKHVDESEVKADFEVLLYAYLKSKNDEYEKLYDVLLVDFNPIENYSMVEVEEISNTSDNMYGAKETSVTDIQSEHTDTESIDYGDKQISSEYDNGEKSSSVNKTIEVSPFDTTSYVADNKEEIETTEDGYTNSETVSQMSYTDVTTKTMGEQSNTSTINDGEHSDTLHTDIERKLTRKGNIGVTTSQQMIDSQIELSKKMNFITKVVNDIADVISKGVYVAL